MSFLQNCASNYAQRFRITEIESLFKAILEIVDMILRSRTDSYEKIFLLPLPCPNLVNHLHVYVFILDNQTNLAGHSKGKLTLLIYSLDMIFCFFAYKIDT